MNPRQFKVANVFSPEEFEMHRQKEIIDFIGLFNFAVRAMQFTYKYTAERNPSWMLPNGTWTGVIGLLNRSEVDFVSAPFVVTADRWEAVNFNYPYASDEYTFVTKKPSYRPDIMAMFRTLSGLVWAALLVSVLLVAVMLFVVLRYRYTLGDAMLHVLAISLNQGRNVRPKKAAGIMLLGTWMLAMALFTACFTSVLLSFLSYPPLTGVRTVPELADAIRAGEYSAMGMVGSILPLYLQRSSNEDARLIGESALKNSRGVPEDLLNRNVDTNVASVSKRSYVTYLKDKLYVSKDSMGFALFSTAVSKDFCCRNEMDRVVHRFLAAGIDVKITRLSNSKRAFRYLSVQPDEEDVVLRKITLTDIFGAFIFLVAGYSLSAFTLIIELVVKRMDMRSSPNL